MLLTSQADYVPCKKCQETYTEGLCLPLVLKVPRAGARGLVKEKEEAT